jgi:geranylgeranyl diphosphate synthase type I
MDVYEQIVASFAELPCVGEWDQALDLMQRIAARKPYHWRLPARACLAVGGSPDQAIPAALAVACCHLSIILVDDMLDCDPRGEYHQIGAPAAANLAAAFQAAALAAIDGCPAATASLNRMMLVTSLGQYWDSQSPADEEGYWRVVRAKSSPFFGTALRVGALLGGAAPQAAGQLKELGALYGEMIQVHDDLNDSMLVPANADWLQGRFSLPILFARSVPHPARERFVQLCGQVADPQALAEAQEILIQCGAVSYCVEQLLTKYQSMQTMLAALLPRARDEMESLAQEVIAPVWKLFEELEVSSVVE